MASWESERGRRAARFYGPERVQWSRSARISWLREEIARSQALDEQERATHKADCAECQSEDGWCLIAMSFTPEQSKRWERSSFMRGLIGLEEADEEYAQHARVYGVDYRKHVDGNCRYWQNVRHRKFESVGYRCERCGEPGPLEAHHIDPQYRTLGFEELEDIS
jgi:hypothetical protein